MVSFLRIYLFREDNLKFEKIVYFSKDNFFVLQKGCKIFTFKKNSLSKNMFFKQRISHIKGLLMLLYSNRLKKYIKSKKKSVQKISLLSKVIFRDSTLITHYAWPTTWLWKILIKILPGCIRKEVTSYKIHILGM